MSLEKRVKQSVKSAAKTYRVPSGLQSEVCFRYLESLDCPRSLTVAILFRYGEYKQLVELGFNPDHYESLDQVRDSYAATAFLSKNQFLETGIDLKEVALKKFSEFEDLCKNTNKRFRNLTLDPSFTGPNVWLLNAVTCKIREILGPFNVDSLFRATDWGPGVSQLVKGENTSATNKFQNESGITRDLYQFLVDHNFSDQHELWQGHLDTLGFPTFSNGNYLTTVPKNAKTDRVIAIEPGLNLWVQKGIGSLIRRRLKLFGVDLNSQERNQSLAQVASIRGHLATVDFSSASDSISRELVREILPTDWFEVMDASRSQYGNHNNQVQQWAKFSSMGNGFTFELESLIFFAAAQAVVEFRESKTPIVSIFGDDVIIPVDCYDTFLSFSAFLGFSPSKEKSFANGYFRESCGSYYWKGNDVKPFFFKKKLNNFQAVLRTANAIRVLAHRRNHFYGCDLRLRSVWRALASVLPKALKPLVPLRLGDSGLISNFDEAMPKRAPFGLEGWTVLHLSWTPVKVTSEDVGVLLSRLWTLEKSSEVADGELVTRFTRYGLRRLALRSRDIVSLGRRNSDPLRGRTRLTVTVSLVSQWDDLGPWT